MTLADHASGARHGHKVLLVLGSQGNVPQLDRHAEGQFPKPHHVLPHEQENVIGFLLGDGHGLEDVGVGQNILNPHHHFPGGQQVEVDIEGTGDQRLEVRGETRILLGHAVEVQVGDKDNAAAEVKGIRDIVTGLILEGPLRQPRDRPLAGRIQGGFQQVEGDLVLEDGVGVIEQDNAIVMAVVPHQLVETGRLNVALHRAEDNLGLFRAGVKDRLQRMGLADASVTTDNQAAELAIHDGITEAVQGRETAADVFQQFSVGNFGGRVFHEDFAFRGGLRHDGASGIHTELLGEVHEGVFPATGAVLFTVGNPIGPVDTGLGDVLGKLVAGDGGPIGRHQVANDFRFVYLHYSTSIAVGGTGCKSFGIKVSSSSERGNVAKHLFLKDLNPFGINPIARKCRSPVSHALISRP